MPNETTLQPGRTPANPPPPPPAERSQVAMDHSPRLEREPIEVTPSNGWRNFEPGDTARFTCGCGIDTGDVPVLEATATARQHLQLLGVPV